MYLSNTIVYDINSQTILMIIFLYYFIQYMPYVATELFFILTQRILINTGGNSDGNRSQFPIVP